MNRHHNADNAERKAEDFRRSAAAENIKKKNRKLYQNQKAKEKSSAQKIAKPFRLF